MSDQPLHATARRDENSVLMASVTCRCGWQAEGPQPETVRRFNEHYEVEHV